MKYVLTLEAEFLKAELFERESLDDARAFLHSVFWASVQHLRANVLIDVRSEKPLFSSQDDEIFPFVRRLAWYRTNRIALIGNVQATELPNAEVESHAGDRGIRLRSFTDEASALKWFRDRRGADRRQALIRLRSKSSRPVRMAPRAEGVSERRESRDRRQSLPDTRFSSNLSRL